MENSKQVIMVTYPYPGYYGYFYPKEVLLNTPDALIKLGSKYNEPDLFYYSPDIIKAKDFQGLLFIIGDLCGKRPMLTCIEVRKGFAKYKVLNPEEVLNGSRSSKYRQSSRKTKITGNTT